MRLKTCLVRFFRGKNKQGLREREREGTEEVEEKEEREKQEKAAPLGEAFFSFPEERNHLSHRSQLLLARLWVRGDQNELDARVGGVAVVTFLGACLFSLSLCFWMTSARKKMEREGRALTPSLLLSFFIKPKTKNQLVSLAHP